MIRSLCAGLALCAALAVALPLPAAAQLNLKPGEWAQAKTDLPADRDIRFGALPNGMRYAIRKQTIPPKQAAVRLWFDTGSLNETDAQQGLAHFLEHMAFNGSKGVKEGEMIKMLERLGLAFGPDTNASTGFDETTYKLDLPRTDDETVDTALMLLREAAGNLTIDQAAVDRERGVVLSEERARDTPGYRLMKERFAFQMPGQRVPTRYPIGQVEVLKTAPAAELRDYYQRWYRPERAVLVVVGDFDVAAMEAKVRAAFADWQAVGPAGVEPDLGAVKPRQTEVKVVVEPGAPLNMQIAWVRPPDLRADSRAKRRADLVERLGFSVLNRRLSQIARAADPPFIGAGASSYEMLRSQEITGVGVSAQPGRWKAALEAVEREQRRAVQYGVRQDELDREIEEMRAAFKAAVAGAATRRPAELAGEIVSSLGEDLVVTSPADDFALFEESVRGLKAEEVSAALKRSFTGSGPLVFVATPQPIEGAEKTVLAAFEGSRQVAVTPSAAPAQIAWPYESFGPAGKVAERRELADIGATFIRFENGVRLTVKPTDFRDDEVLVRVNVGDGLLSLPKDRQGMGWTSSAFIEGGLKKISNDDMERVLAAKVYGASFGITDDAFVLSGGTRTGDLPTQLQVLAAYLAEPGWRPEAFARLKTAFATAHDQLEATDSGVLQRELAGLVRSGDRRWTYPSRTEISEATLADLQSQVAPHLARDPVEVVIVGDTTVEAAIAAMSTTFGALPARAPARTIPDAERRVVFPVAPAEPVVFTHKGRADQSIAYIAWPTTDVFANPQQAREIATLGEVMRLRLTDELREVQGATYSPGVNYSQNLVWTGWGYIAASVEVPPAKLEEFFADVRRIAADLRARPVSQDELDRAKKPRIESLQRARLGNGYWVAQLSDAQADPRRLELIRDQIPGAQKVTAADVQRAAQAFLTDDKAYRIVVRPQDAQTRTAAKE
ncbi:pitrilysin family protein [Phenylobacterium sp. J367]|uniref:M16 family metallopeptidase n=1 Tax=Phenylobacterium sp. J367 TaxID=2898435 RepID=UPI002150CF92|nr:M16 family metallopeptidase [Phenylobacterium sp. J367]MCR5879343.1 insulinase family protein [Phenylobacterium sp. J367]